MRIKLKRGFQKKLVLEAKGNQTWKELSGNLGIGLTYLAGELFAEKRLISQEIYEKLCTLSQKNYDGYIEEKLEDYWGRAKGGKNSKKTAKLLINEKSIELAELMGIIIGDGNVWVKEGGYYYLTITGDKNKDEDYLTNYVNNLFSKLFGQQMQVHKNKNNNGMYLKIGRKNVIFTLNKWGFPSGDKKKNNIRIPKWIFKNKNYLKACVRGLIDTDGSVCAITGRDYPYIWFSSNIPNLREDFSRAMKILGFNTSKWNIRENHAADCYIAKKEHIVRFLKEIGFSNLKHNKSCSRFKWLASEMDDF